VQEVVVGALVRGGRLLLSHRRADKRAYPDVWELPGGVIEPGESELEALVRELREELGVQISPDSVTHLVRVAAGPAGERALISAWLVRDWIGAPANVAPEEHDDIGWFDLEQLPPPAHVVIRTALLQAVRSDSAGASSPLSGPSPMRSGPGGHLARSVPVHEHVGRHPGRSGAGVERPQPGGATGVG
jgi:8-oxo-dGTP diphosphatase